MAQTVDCRLCGCSFVRPGSGRHLYCKRCTTRTDREVSRVRRVDCKECGRPFSTTYRGARYCSDECRADARRRRAREYVRRRWADPGKRAIVAAHTRAIAARRRAADAGGRPKTGQGRRQEAGSAAKTRTFDCKLCGRSFELRGRGVRSYCKQCIAKSDRAAATAPRRHCKECGRRFESKARFALYCSKECSANGAQRSLRSRGRKRMADPEERALAAARQRAMARAKGKA